MVALLTLAALLTATPEVAVIKRSSGGVSEETLATVLRNVTEGLTAIGVAVRVVPSTCTTDVRCLAAIAHDNHLAAVVGVTVVLGRRAMTVDLEGIDAQGRQIAVQTFDVPLSGSPFPEDGREFLKSLRQALKPAEDAPREVHLEPRGESVGSEVRVGPRARFLRIAGVATIATAAAGVGCLIAGAVIKGQLDGRLREGPVVIGLTRAQAQGQAALSNGLFTTSLVTLMVATAVAVFTGRLWFQAAESNEAEE